MRTKQWHTQWRFTLPFKGMFVWEAQVGPLVIQWGRWRNHQKRHFVHFWLDRIYAYSDGSEPEARRWRVSGDDSKCNCCY